ncbi:MAG: hypothetical protein ACKPHU_00565, partial [Planctomycetaceae bacterium]
PECKGFFEELHDWSLHQFGHVAFHQQLSGFGGAFGEQPQDVPTSRIPIERGQRIDGSNRDAWLVCRPASRPMRRRARRCRQAVLRPTWATTDGFGPWVRVCSGLMFEERSGRRMRCGGGAGEGPGWGWPG